MKFFLMIAALGFLCACGDKDEDTGTDTAAAVDSGDTASEQSQTAGGHGLQVSYF